MAKLPYKFTVCPDEPEPVRFTASCAQMGNLLKQSPKGDLTIDQRMYGYWQSWTNKPLQPYSIEDWIAEIGKSIRARGKS